MQFITKTLISSGENLLLEFFSDELTASEDICTGGFLAHAAVLGKNSIYFRFVPFKNNRKDCITCKRNNVKIFV